MQEGKRKRGKEGKREKKTVRIRNGGMWKTERICQRRRLIRPPADGRQRSKWFCWTQAIMSKIKKQEENFLHWHFFLALYFVDLCLRLQLRPIYRLILIVCEEMHSQWGEFSVIDNKIQFLSMNNSRDDEVKFWGEHHWENRGTKRKKRKKWWNKTEDETKRPGKKANRESCWIKLKCNY